MAVLSAAAGGALLFDFSARGNAAIPSFDAARGFGFEPGTPNRFSIQVSEGNHRVTLHFERRRQIFECWRNNAVSRLITRPLRVLKRCAASSSMCAAGASAAARECYRWNNGATQAARNRQRDLG